MAERWPSSTASRIEGMADDEEMPLVDWSLDPLIWDSVGLNVSNTETRKKTRCTSMMLSYQFVS
jgi:hypothetical protein